MSLRMSDRMVADLDAVEVAARRQIEAELERPSPDLKRKIRALAAAAMSVDDDCGVKAALVEARRQLIEDRVACARNARRNAWGPVWSSERLQTEENVVLHPSGLEETEKDDTLFMPYV